MNIIMETTGRGITFFEPPTSTEELILPGVSQEFKNEFLSHWKDAYEAEKESGNAGVNLLCVLEKIQTFVEKGEINFTTTFEQAYKLSVRAIMYDM